MCKFIRFIFIFSGGVLLISCASTPKEPYTVDLKITKAEILPSGVCKFNALFTNTSVHNYKGVVNFKVYAHDKNGTQVALFPLQSKFVLNSQGSAIATGITGTMDNRYCSVKNKTYTYEYKLYVGEGSRIGWYPDDRVFSGTGTASVDFKN